jgi:uncharacterized membrane protein YhaH (DUF805 family)
MAVGHAQLPWVGNHLLHPLPFTAMTLLLHFFSPQGRFKRLTFWEGIVAWIMANTLIAMCEVYVVSMPVFWMFYSSPTLSHLTFEDILAAHMGDADHLVFHYLTSAMFFVHWVVAIWVLAAICAKRWHDLSFPGWLAVVNSLPVVFVGVVFLSFFGSVDRDLIHRLTITPDPQNSVFTIMAAARKDYLTNYLETHVLTAMFFATFVLGSFVYLGLMRGDDRANSHGKATG